MAAQVDLGRRREPAELVLARAPPTRNAVSERLFSAAIACSVASGSQASSGQTAAGLPAKTRLVNASTWKSGIFMRLD